MLRFLLACCLFAPSLLAQTSPELRPPVVQSSTEVPYPEGGEGDAMVILELVVGQDGRVSQVDVIEGAEPFAEQARRAATGWVFEPARRRATAIAARIRASVAFRRAAPAIAQPANAGTAAQAEPSAAATPSAPATASAAPDAPIELVVVGQRREIGETTLSTADVRQMPGAFGDAFRAVEALPGVTPVLSGLPYFFIRGAPPNNNGYFVDGVRVPFLFHVGLGPAVIHPGLLDHVDFYAGAAPASYGGVAGGIIAGQTRAPATAFHGEANLRLFDAGALVEAPFASERGSALVAGRYGYPGPILSAVGDIRLGYWDYQSRLAYRVSEHGSVALLAFGSHDELSHVDSKTGLETQDLASDFHRLDVRYDYQLPSSRLRLGATLGYDSQGSSPTFLLDRSAAFRADLEHDLAASLRLRAGVRAELDGYRFRREAPVDPQEAVVPSNADPPRTNLTLSAYADAIWHVTPRIEVVPGARMTAFNSMRARSQQDPTRLSTTVPAVDPRLSTRVIVSPGVAYLANFGLTHQLPVLRVGPLPAAAAAGAGFPDGSSRLQQVLQMSQGVEVALPAEITFSAVGFLSRSWGLTDLTAMCLQLQPPSAPAGMGGRADDPYFCPNNAPSTGQAYGLELLVRRALTARLSGWLSYTLSRSVRTAHFLTLDGGDAQATVPSEFDRTHLLNVVLAYTIGRGWRVGGRAVVYSGAPYSRLAGDVPVPPYNSLRDPAFFRLDTRLEKRWFLGHERSIAFVLEGVNVTLSKETNTLGLDCQGEMESGGPSTTQCQRGKIGPLSIPSVGVEAIF